MKKLWFVLVVLIVGLAALVVYQNLPQKRFARHMVKARLYAKENNFTAAQLEYEKAYSAVGGFTPYVSFEVLQLMNRKSMADKNGAEVMANTKAFVKAHPDNKDGRILLSQLAFQSGDLETAFDAVNGVLAADPRNFPARMLMTRVRTMQGRLDLAEQQLRYLYREYPDSLPAILPLAENLLKQGKIEESRKFVEDVLKGHPKNAAARLLLVDSYLMEKKTDSAQAVLEAWQLIGDRDLIRPLAVRRARLQALAGNLPQAEATLLVYRQATEENAPALMELAVIETAKGRYDSAIQVYSSVGEALPAARAVVGRMRVLLNLKNRNPAAALQEAMSIQVGGKDAELVPLILAANVAMGQTEKAQALIEAQPPQLRPALTRMLSQWPQDKDFIGQWALAEYYRLNSEAYWTLNAAQSLYKDYPQNPMAISLYASQLASLRQYGAAAKLMEGISQTSQPMQGALVALYIKAGERDKAKALAEKMLAQNPKQRGLNTLLADYAWSKGDRKKGVALYEKELELDGNDPVALNNLAWEYGIVEGNLEKAMPYVDKLRAQKTQDARIWDTIGWIFARNGKTAEGEKYLRQALNLVPDYPSYLYHLGWIQGKSGDKAAAKADLRTALDSKIPFEERKDAEALLAQLD